MATRDFTLPDTSCKHGRSSSDCKKCLPYVRRIDSQSSIPCLIGIGAHITLHPPATIRASTPGPTKTSDHLYYQSLSSDSSHEIPNNENSGRRTHHSLNQQAPSSRGSSSSVHEFKDPSKYQAMRFLNESMDTKALAVEYTEELASVRREKHYHAVRRIVRHSETRLGSANQ